MMAGLDERPDDTEGGGHGAPVWAVFGDLMSGLVGAFVLILVGVLVVQMDLVNSLQAEVRKFLTPAVRNGLEPLCGHTHQLSFIAVHSTRLSLPEGGGDDGLTCILPQRRHSER